MIYDNENCEKQQMRKVVVYHRYALSTQDTDLVEFQLKQIEEFADKCGMNIIEQYVDRGCSGLRIKRPEFLNMLSVAEKDPEWDAVLCYKPSCFARDYRVYEQAQSILNEHGIEIISVT